MKRYLVAAASFISGAMLVPQPASALVSYSGGLVYDSTIQVTAQGFGNVPRLLTVQGNANSTTTESGCVSASGGINFGASACDGTLFANTGGDEPNPLADNQKYGIPTLDELGWKTAADIGLVFNPNQTGFAPITVDDITLKIYDGDTLFAQINGSQAFATTDPGVGSAGFVFRLDAGILASVDTNVFGAAGSDNFRVALENTNSLFNDGPESWAAVDLVPGNGGGGVPPVPEPATWALLLMGFGFVGARLRRGRRQSALQTV